MKVFVTGATGFQGKNIAKALIKEGHQVTTLKRNLDVEKSKIDEIEVIKGGLENSKALSKAMQDKDAAVYSFPLIFDMNLAKAYTNNFISAAIEKNVSLIIFNTTFHLPQNTTGFLTLDLKVEIKKLFDASKLKVITLMPDIYLDNIAAPWSIPVILKHKVVAYPIDGNKKMPWISHSELGRYITKAISKPELAGQTLPIGGNLITGREITEAISSEINLNLNFVSVPVNEFEQQLTPGFGALAAKEISNLYRYVEQNYNDFITKDFNKTNKLLDISPQSLNTWVKSVNWE